MLTDKSNVLQKSLYEYDNARVELERKSEGYKKTFFVA